MEREGEGVTGSDLEDVGAGTGPAARDVGEEGDPGQLGAHPGTSELDDEGADWSAIAGSVLTDEGASGGALRDEPAE